MKLKSSYKLARIWDSNTSHHHQAQEQITKLRREGIPREGGHSSATCFQLEAATERHGLSEASLSRSRRKMLPLVLCQLKDREASGIASASCACSKGHHMAGACCLLISDALPAICFDVSKLVAIEAFNVRRLSVASVCRCCWASLLLTPLLPPVVSGSIDLH